MHLSDSAPELVRRYFTLAAQPDSEAYFALFADDAAVEDEGSEHRGLPAIRQWRAKVPLVRYDVTALAEAADGVVATTTISGDFPGSPVVGLKFHFQLRDGLIQRLSINP